MAGSLDADDISTLNKLLENSSSVAIVCHQNPDGDAVGSSLGLAAVLRKIGKETDVVMPNRPPEFLQWMSGFDSVIFGDADLNKANELIKKADLLFCLDFNSSDRTGVLQDQVSAHQCRVLVDHHQDPEDGWALKFSDTAKSSTCELVIDVLEGISFMEYMDRDAASCFYTGIMTDTGSFRYPATTADTHRVAAKLLELGVDHSAIHTRVLDSNSEDRMRLWGLALRERLKVLHDGQFAVISLSKQDLHRFHYRPGDTEGLVNQGLSIKGVRMAMFLAEQDSYIKMSARSIGDLPVHLFMRQHFSGGGHKNAAGGRSTESINTTVERVIDEAGKFLNDHPV